MWAEREWRVTRGEEGGEGCRERTEEASECEGEGVGVWRVIGGEDGGGEVAEERKEA